MKRKIKIYNKTYAIQVSPLFNIQHKKRLFEILEVSEEQFGLICENKANYYNIFLQDKRQIESPCKILHTIHNRIASLICRIEVPDYLFSGIKGKSYVENAKVHQCNVEALTTDITSFYPSTNKTMVFKFFRNVMQCSHTVSNMLAELCTIQDHLPTGSQISMPLAYWVNSKMFKDIYNLARKNNLIMTVYVDDITFSGDKIPRNFIFPLRKIIEYYNHKIKKEKLFFIQKNL